MRKEGVYVYGMLDYLKVRSIIWRFISPNNQIITLSLFFIITIKIHAMIWFGIYSNYLELNTLVETDIPRMNVLFIQR